MKRKVVKHGPSTLIVSLPLRWVKKYNVNKGDELEVEEEGSRLIVSTGKGKKLGAVEADLSKLDRTSIMYLIRSLYKLGYDEIKLNFNKQSTFHYRLEKDRTIISVIHEEVNRLTGVEVIQQKENFCVIKALSDMNFEEFNPVLRRIFLQIIDMSNDMINGAQKQDLMLLKTLEEKHNTITKFLSFCMRLLNQKEYPDHKKTLIMYNTISMLDKLLDILKNSGRNLINLKPRITPKTKELMGKIHEAIVTYYHLFYKFNNREVMKIAELRDNILKDIQSCFNELSKKELLIINNLAPVLELVLAMTETRMALEY